MCYYVRINRCYRTHRSDWRHRTEDSFRKHISIIIVVDNNNNTDDDNAMCRTYWLGIRCLW